MGEAGGEVYKAEESGETIDIILPTHGRLDLTIRCVSAIYAYTKSPFNLIVVDDSTPDMDEGKDRTPQWFERLQIEQTNITFIHSETPFKSGNQIFNVGLAHSSSSFVATIMNSVRVEPDWDIVAVQMMQANPKIGVIGLKCLKHGWNREGQPPEDGQIECAGIVMNGFIPSDVGRDDPGHRRSFSEPAFSLQWAFALLRREAVVGNLDEDLWHGFVGFDDIDNTLYLRYKGWEAWYCGLGSGYHETHATRGSGENSALLANRKNAEIFYKRWGYWDAFKKKNPYAPEYYPMRGLKTNGKVKFLTNANDLPLEVKK